jgi:hypothetical protein
MFGQILQKFAEKSPATVMVRALLEQLLNPEKLDQWFEVTRQTQYTRDLEPLVQFLGVEQLLQQSAYHDGGGAFLGKFLKDLTKHGDWGSRVL